MTITVILQTRNEESSGHLARFLNWNMPLIDNLVAYDDYSSDQTVEMLEAAGAEVIIGSFHSFQSELHIKDLLLRRALELFPETSWFLWLDADEVLLESRDRLNELLQEAHEQSIDGIRLPLVNLWRSKFFFRMDSGYNQLENIRFWKNTGNLHFQAKPGLHLPMHPDGMEKVSRMDSPRILHFGFSSRGYIVSKFLTYQKSGQRARDLWRLVDESTLELNSIEKYADKLGQRFTDFYQLDEFPQSEISDQRSLFEYCHFEVEKDSILESPSVTILAICSTDNRVTETEYGQFLRMQKELGGDEIEILYVVSESSINAIQFLVQNRIPHVVASNGFDTAHSLTDTATSLYMFGLSMSRGKYILVTTPNVTYSQGFIVNLLSNVKENVFLASKKVRVSSRLKLFGDATRLLIEPYGRQRASWLLKYKSDTNVSLPIFALREALLNLDQSQVGLVIGGNLQLSKMVMEDTPEVFVCDKSVAYYYERDIRITKRLIHPSREDSGVSWDEAMFKIYGNPLIHSQAFNPFKARIHVTSSIDKVFPGQVNLLVTNNLNAVKSLKIEQMRSLSACITSNPDVITFMAVTNNVHCYLVEDSSEKNLETFPAIIEGIITRELRQTFLPVVKIAFKRKLIDSLPTALRTQIRGFRSLFRPQ